MYSTYRLLTMGSESLNYGQPPGPGATGVVHVFYHFCVSASPTQSSARYENP